MIDTRREEEGSLSSRLELRLRGGGWLEVENRGTWGGDGREDETQVGLGWGARVREEDEDVPRRLSCFSRLRKKGDKML